MKRIALVGTIAFASITGCSTTPTGGGTGGGSAVAADCDDHGVCKVAVSVSSCKVGTPVPDPLTVDEGKHNVVIEWDLGLDWWAGYRFVDEKAIIIKNGHDQFDTPATSGSGKKVTLHDKNGVKDVITYAIHVRSIYLGDCAVVDPTIKNQG